MTYLFLMPANIPEFIRYLYVAHVLFLGGRLKGVKNKKSK